MLEELLKGKQSQTKESKDGINGPESGNERPILSQSSNRPDTADSEKAVTTELPDFKENLKKIKAPRTFQQPILASQKLQTGPKQAQV